MRGRRPGWWAAALPAAWISCASAGCSSTTDSVGWDAPPNVRLQRLRPLPSYPNAFKDLGKSDAEIATKIANAFNQLFYGEPTSEAIYFERGADQAVIEDILHNHEVRTEGIGLAMMICVQLDKRAEFDRLWRYADSTLKQTVAPRNGYFESRCDTLMPTVSTPCDDPYGASQILMALIFAHDRWTSTGTLDYEKGATALLDVMRHQQDYNGGTPDGVTNTFDGEKALPYDVPNQSATDRSRPSIVMPAYYDLWAEAAGDRFWNRAARAARQYWKDSAHSMTGLMPVRAKWSGMPFPYWENFDSESYRAQVNMTLDHIWRRSPGDNWEVGEADLLLRFFKGKGLMGYGAAYKLDGTPVDVLRDFALVSVNGVTGMIATDIARSDFVNAVWEIATPAGPARYYSGLLNLTALLILSGQYRVW
jgi:oligosaccharide reducing-end xylanase